MDPKTAFKEALHIAAGVIMPFLGPKSGKARWLAWMGHGPLLIALMVYAWRLQETLDLGTVVQAPWPILQEAWLPLLSMLTYVLAWLGYWLWKLLGLGQTAGPFADVDEAWQEASQALEQAGIDIQEMPLFLLLGRPAGLFEAAGLNLIIPPSPSRPDARFTMSATRDAVFLTSSGITRLGNQAEMLACEEAANTSRLQHLCRLLARARRPYCPINGIVLLFPLETLTDDAAANQAADLAQRNVRAVQKVLRLECPYFVVVRDLEKAPGFAEFIGRLSKTERCQRLGRRFPLLLDVDPAEIQATFQNWSAGLCRGVAGTIGSCLRHEDGATTLGQLPPALRANFRLFELQAFLRQGYRRLGQIIYLGTQVEPGMAAMVAGCYFVATGADHEQAFAKDLFVEFLRNQNFVSWSIDAVAEEAGYRRLSQLGYIGFAGVMVILGILGTVWAR